MMLLQTASARSNAATSGLLAAAFERSCLIRERTMHHAETSEASFNRLAAVAVLAP